MLLRSYAGTYFVSARNWIRVMGCDSNHARQVAQILSIDSNSGDHAQPYPQALPPWIPSRQILTAFISFFSIFVMFMLCRLIQLIMYGKFRTISNAHKVRCLESVRMAVHHQRILHVLGTMNACVPVPYHLVL